MAPGAPGPTRSTLPLSARDDLKGLVGIFGEWDVGADGQDVGFGCGSFLVVETYGAVLAKIVGVACFSVVQTFDSIHATASGHLSLAIEHQINFFSDFVMVGKICAARRKIHEEKIGDIISGVDAIARGSVRAYEQLV